MAQAQARPRAGGKITGWHVFTILVAFFGVIISVNVVMAHYAISTFGGLETESSYKAGLAFRGEEIAAADQDARKWQVNLTVRDGADGSRIVAIEAVDAKGNPLAGYDVDARFAHPADARQDVVVDLNEATGGRYQGTASVHKGQWELIVDLAQGGTRLFRSKNRVQLR
ncbi:FixH family protein [Azorhizobium doebereinerae]|uniref:FixH family protein n=1 Tax=Azorhizobium doebereinerae TaxID=281091 RepID=UPI00040487A9|nr:FixH family protein [Azorhizobium doebereinerae]